MCKLPQSRRLLEILGFPIAAGATPEEVWVPAHKGPPATQHPSSLPNVLHQGRMISTFNPRTLKCYHLYHFSVKTKYYLKPAEK